MRTGGAERMARYHLFTVNRLRLGKDRPERASNKSNHVAPRSIVSLLQRTRG